MTRSISSKLTAILAVATLCLFACTTTSETEPVQESMYTGTEFRTGDQEDVEAVTIGDSATARLDLPTLYFEFDQSNIDDDARVALRSSGEQLLSTGASVRLEGYCDERGDEEYNLALGERRANTVKRYLVNLGVSSSQLRTLSYGEAKPAVAGHNEAAWRYNRRVEFHDR